MSARIKGATILNTLGLLREITDRQRFQLLISDCPVATQQFLQRTLMAVEWVPVDVWGPMLSAIFERIAGRDDIKFRKFMRAVCKRDFTGPYRAYVQAADPVALMNKVQSIWGAYFDSGTLVSSIKESDSARQHYLIELRGLNAESTLYMSVVHGLIEQLLLMVEAKTPVVTRHRELRVENRWSCDFAVAFN